MRAVLLLVLACLTAPAAFAFDWGGSVENVLYDLITSTATPNSTLSENPTVRLWANWTFGPGVGLLAKANLNDTFALGYGGGSTLTNTVSGDLDYLVFTTSNLWVGRTDFREFSGTVLSTKLDGIQYVFSFPNLDLKAMAGTSAAVFKSGNTIDISEDDTKDRQVLESLTNPSTLWAPPRVVADVELTSRQWIPDQTFHFALLGQYDLRSGEAKDGDQANVLATQRHGAPVSTAYLGTGGEGRIVGPLYWNAWAYVEGGTSLTAVGAPNKQTNPDKSVSYFQTWKSSYLLGGIGSADLTLLMPSFHFLVVDLGVQMGSWDSDGATPDTNNATSTTSTTPKLYTGWVGISQTSTSLIFNPQPANMVITQLQASIKVLDPLQLVSSSFLFVRPTTAPIVEVPTLNGAPVAYVSSSDLYLGLESDLSAVWRPTSDLGLTFAVGLFAPNSSAMNRKLETKLQTTCNLSF